MMDVPNGYNTRERWLNKSKEKTPRQGRGALRT